MPATEINHVNLRTDREIMQKLKDIYSGILGLTVEKIFPARQLIHPCTLQTL